MNQTDINVYITALRDSLIKKEGIMNSLLELTIEQGNILKKEEPDIGRFDVILQEKGVLLKEITELDRWFDSIYEKVQGELQEKKYQYQSQILEFQNLIRAITDTGMQIEGQEARNKKAFQEYLSGAKKEIKSFKVNNKTATSYYQNMANQHREWNSYFMDQKK